MKQKEEKVDLAQQDGEITVLLPALNEERSIGLVIDEIRSLPVSCRILVIDNGSRDLTPAIAYSKHVSMVTETSRGKGNAVKTGIRLLDTPYVIMMNSDHTYPARDLKVIHGILKLGHYDVVIGCRQLKEPGSMGSANSLANWLLSRYTSILYGYSIYDLCTGMWGFKTDTLKSFHLTSSGFTLEADLFVNSLRSKCRILQIPIGYRPRLDGSKAKVKVWDGARIGWFLLRNRWKLSSGL